jgi:hypothetical protein
MPDENDLRDLFTAPQPPIDLDSRSVIEASARRRRPKQAAIGVVGALAVVGIVTLGVQGLPLVQQSALSTQDQGLAPAAPNDNAGAATTSEGTTSGIKRAPAEKINLCEGTVAGPIPSASGLRLELAFPASAPVGATTIDGVVRLVNAGTERVTGTTAAGPAITLSQAGIVLWHSPAAGDLSAVAIDLAPGQSREYPASFVPVRCSVADDEAQSFRADLPAAPAGGYELSAAIDFAPSAPSGDLDLVTSDQASITLH